MKNIISGLKLKAKAVAATYGLRGPQDKLKARLDAKRAYWFGNPDAPSEVKALAALASNKLLMRRHVKSLGLRLPDMYCDVDDVDAINFAGNGVASMASALLIMHSKDASIT